MLVIGRLVDERARIRVGAVDVWVTFVGFDPDDPRRIRLGFEGPPEAAIDRLERLPEAERPCAKRRFPTARAAMASIGGMRVGGIARPERGARVLNAYVCDRCGGFHIGHRRPRAAARESRAG